MVSGEVVDASPVEGYLIYDSNPKSHNKISETKKIDLDIDKYNLSYKNPTINEMKEVLKKFSYNLLETKIVRISQITFNLCAPGSSHPMTTRRMGKEAHSILDGNPEFSGFDNIFVSGTSVVSTPGVANPTLTALALRVVDFFTLVKESKLKYDNSN